MPAAVAGPWLPLGMRCGERQAGAQPFPPGPVAILRWYARRSTGQRFGPRVRRGRIAGRISCRACLVPARPGRRSRPGHGRLVGSLAHARLSSADPDLGTARRPASRAGRRAGGHGPGGAGRSSPAGAAGPARASDDEPGTGDPGRLGGTPYSDGSRWSRRCLPWAPGASARRGWTRRRIRSNSLSRIYRLLLCCLHRQRMPRSASASRDAHNEVTWRCPARGPRARCRTQPHSGAGWSSTGPRWLRAAVAGTEDLQSGNARGAGEGAQE